MKDLVLNIQKKVNDLISIHNSLKLEKEEILKENNQLRKEVSDHQSVIDSLEDKIKLLKISRSTSTPDVEKDKQSRQKINEYVREIDRCIALLNR